MEIDIQECQTHWKKTLAFANADQVESPNDRASRSTALGAPVTFFFVCLLILAASCGGFAVLFAGRWSDAKTHALDFAGLIAIGVLVFVGSAIYFAAGGQ